MYDFLEYQDDWQLQVFLLLLNEEGDSSSFKEIKQQLIENQHSQSSILDLNLWNYIVDAFCLDTELFIPSKEK